jgi:hypothetical protein
MKTTYALILPTLMILAMFACKKPHLSDNYGIDSNEPIVFTARLSDSIPAKTFELLQVSEIEGISVKYVHERREVRYFEYDAESERVLSAIRRSPFSIDAQFADTGCRQIASNEIHSANHTISSSEKNMANFFWSIKPEEYEVFECVKPFVKHTLLFHKNSTQVLHRIEFLTS